MKSLIRLILVVFIFSGISFSQYTDKDKDLVRTTYLREFNNSIINKYLKSKSDKEVNAALLSIANSADTSFVPAIIKLNFAKHYEYICFVLGELGPSDLSASFLYSKLKAAVISPAVIHSILEALGKTGGKNSYDEIVNGYLTSKAGKYNGISIALYNFYSRGIGNKSVSEGILLNELDKFEKNRARYFEAAFALYRIGLPNHKIYSCVEELKKLYSHNLVNSRNSNLYNSAAAYLIGALRNQKIFPAEDKLVRQIIHTDNYDIKVEAAKSICYYNFSDKNNLLNYLSLINDNNSNVALELAASLKNMSLNNDLLSYVKGFILKAINYPGYSKPIKGELLLSYIKLFKASFKEARKTFGENISQDYYCNAAGLFTSSTDALNYLINAYTTTDTLAKVDILSTLLDFRKSFGLNKNLDDVMSNALSSTEPALISIAADGIDSLLIKKETAELKEIITTQTNKYLNNPDYYESIASLAGLAAKIDNSFYNSILKALQESQIYSVKKFAYKELHLSTSGLAKSTDQFDDIWSFAFKYNGAKIRTVKGTFKIKFLPGYAPVSVGNFCALSKKKFFNNNCFHRVVPGFVIQGGDPTETGWGGSGYDIISEFSPAEYLVGVVGMASAGKDTEGSQWFVTTGAFPHLNGRYTVFARLISGQTVADKTEQRDKILSVTLY